MTDSAHHHGHTGHGRRASPDWDEIYANGPRWDIGRPQPAFLALADGGAIAGRVLDVGCGTGEHVLMCAARGLDATGVDLSRTAIAAAERKAQRRGLTARFLRYDVRRLAELGEAFDTVLDSGLLVHVIDDEADRASFLDGLRAVVPTGGRYFVLCFRGEDATSPTRHLLANDVTACFADGWHVDATDPVTLDSVTDPDGIPGWRLALTRT
jgi:2-polyprenyl-3-methyl-5-hydroxy-6-metoxy-1,4-benzoquinol methylase